MRRKEFTMAEALKDTLNLPKTNFPMRAFAATRELERIAHWESIHLYEKIQKKHATDPVFMLHDGPPFTNGDVHIGTALNKILKDIILRFKTMRGFRTPYIPGWDCHGLPIEHKVSKELREKGETLSIPELRKACAQFSRQFIEKQRRQFRRLGLLADWEHEYRTMNPEYESKVLEFLATCAEKGLIYRSKKPVYWSIPCKTALAEAEIEYKDLKSPSIWVKFPLTEMSAKQLQLEAPVSLVIWTTTPWTLPSNQGIAVHPEFTYAVLKYQDECYVVESSLSERFIADCGWTNVTQVATFLGKSLEGCRARHPFIDRESRVILAEYVTNSAGTGCVHIAPGHGLEDYVAGIQNGLEVYSPLDDEACYINDGQVPECLVGVPVLGKNGRSPANEAVLELLKAKGALLQERPITHSYPHCWRSKTPVIFRAMDQWFIHLDHDGLRERALAAVDSVKWIPSWGENRIRGALETRPDWCISRQRVWGIPLPVFFDENGVPLLDAGVIRGIAQKVAQKGTDIWFEESAESLLEGIDLPAEWRGKKLQKGTDTIDVWLDSGNSCNAVLKARDYLKFPADLYCEGSDQHRGWFQSSLWCSLIMNDVAPYRSILTHGFIVGEDKKKISKSDGKPQTADDYIQRYGADVMRLWISSEDFRNDIPISDSILQHVVSAYHTLRNTLRFQLGNLFDFDYKTNRISHEEMTAIDQWLLEKTRLLILEVTDAYETYEFHKVYKAISYFCSVILSATYHDLLKDRLYTYGPNWKERRSSQTAIYEVLRTLIALLAPITTFTADEAYSYLQCDEDFGEDSVQLLDWPDAESFAGYQRIADEIDAILDVRMTVNKSLEEARKAKLIGKALEARVLLTVGKEHETAPLLKRYEADLPELFLVSQVELVQVDGADLTVNVEHARGERCERSWRWVEEIYDLPGWGKVSARCKKVLEERMASKN